MSLTVFTLVLNGMPTLPCIYYTLMSLNIDWRWVCIEGTAKNVQCSRHCREIEPGLSNDGTTQFLESIASNPRVHYVRQDSWNGKVEMCNTSLEFIKEPCLLMQIDSDELWRADQIEKLHMLCEDWPVGGSAKFYCRYFVGPNLIVVGENAYGNKPTEWVRAWSFQKGMKFDSHCPPVLDGNRGTMMSREQTARLGLVFDHMAYVNKEQVEFKCKYYGYTNCDWDELQKVKEFPVHLKSYLPWVDDKACVTKL